jgi:hypothetical protein
MKHDPEELVEDFARQARTYCEAIDSMDECVFDEWIASVHVALAKVYHAGLLLPDIAPATGDVESTTSVWKELFARLRDYLGEHDVYRAVWDPHDRDDEPNLAHLSDDLADVYSDLTEGLDLIASGADPADVVWTWRFAFNLH